MLNTSQKSYFDSLPGVLFPCVGLLCLTPWISSAVALTLGILFSLMMGNPYLASSRVLTQRLLQLSIIGLGAGMNLSVIGQVGFEGLGYTIVGIFFTLVAGTFLGRILKSEREVSLLVTVGTAICGGSAIAAVASTIRAKSAHISVALATVFFLNASALFIFPPIGHALDLTQLQFGLWSALAIHDTSSVVGAALQYGAQATEIATTVKLARALWIVPVSLGIGYHWSRRNKDFATSKTPKKYPWFILGFLAAAALVTWVPALQATGVAVHAVAKRTLVLTLFLIGGGLTRDTLRHVGMKPLIQGFLLWALTASSTLGAIWMGWIH